MEKNSVSVDGVPTKNKETSDQVLEKAVGMCKDSDVDIPKTVFDRAHRIGETYIDKKIKNSYKSIIVFFSTF